MVLLRKNIVFSIVFIMCLSLMMPNVQAFFGGNSEDAIDVLDKQVAEKAQEYESVVSGLKDDLAATTQKLEDAHAMIEELNKKISDAEAMLGNYKMNLAAIEGLTHVATDESAEEGKATFSDLVAKVKNTVTGSEKLCEACGEIKGSEQCCVEGAVICDVCGLHKGSPGCCKDVKDKEVKE